MAIHWCMHELTNKVNGISYVRLIGDNEDLQFYNFDILKVQQHDLRNDFLVSKIGTRSRQRV